MDRNKQAMQAAAPTLYIALANLLDDVEGFIDMGIPFEDPNNGFHESVMLARAALEAARVKTCSTN